MTEESVLKTLRRVPDRIILATMGRELEFSNPTQCLCGWFIREKIAEMTNCGASTVTEDDCAPRSDFSVLWSQFACAEQFGGEQHEWTEIFVGVCHGENLRIIESAFVRRVDEAVFGASDVE